MRTNQTFTPTAVLFMLLLAFNGCKKDKDEVLESARVKTHSLTNLQSGYALSETYSYDAQGRVTLVEYSNGNREDYSYAANQVTISYSDTSLNPPYVITVNLNSRGLAESCSDGRTFEYNAEGYLVKENLGVDSFVYYNYINGNLVARTRVGPGGIIIDYSFRTFTTDKQEFRDYGVAFWGKRNKNLVQSMQFNAFIDFHTYEFDSKGRVSKEIVTTNVNQIIEHLYTY